MLEKKSAKAKQLSVECVRLLKSRSSAAEISRRFAGDLRVSLTLASRGEQRLLVRTDACLHEGIACIAPL